MHDLVIEHALLLDGLGPPRRPGGVAVREGRIVAVGSDLGPARRVEAGGLALAPGIIDIHTHYDAQLTWDPFATPSTALGVTTVVIGNCGFTIAPCRPADRDLTLRNLTHVEGMSLEALRAGVRWEFETYPEFLDAVERRGVVPNVGSFIGHSSLRTYVLGADATRRVASDAEIAEMRRLVRDALAAGAIGFATSTLEQHNGEHGLPMPSRLADERELLALTGALGEAGRGVFMLTKGMRTTVPWLETVAAASGRPVMIAAMFVDPGDPAWVFRELSEIEGAPARGRELWAQVGCFPLGMEFTLRHPYPLEAFLAWRPAIEAPTEAAYRAVLADPGFRKRLKEEAAVPGVPNRFSEKTWPHLTIMEVTRPDHRPGCQRSRRTKSLYGKGPDGIEFEVMWPVPRDQRSEADQRGSPGRSISPEGSPASAVGRACPGREPEGGGRRLLPVGARLSGPPPRVAWPAAPRRIRARPRAGLA
jgi:N-acyl-D-aspartate/D-glutamate deacylase